MNIYLIGFIALASIGVVVKSYLDAEIMLKGYTYAWKISNFKFTGLTSVSFNINIEVTNPSNLSLTLKNPQIKVFYKNTEFVTNKYGTVSELRIDKQSTTKLQAMNFTLNLLDNRIVDLARELYKVKSMEPVYKFFDVQVIGYSGGMPIILKQNMQ